MKESIANSVAGSLTDVPALVEVDRHGALSWAKADRQVHVHLVHNFVSLQAQRPEGSVYAFTSARRREGVSHVIQALGNRLGMYTGAKVLIVTFAQLAALSTFEIKHLEDTWAEQAPGVWSMPRTSREGSRIGPAVVEQEIWSALRAKFQYILIDCPALDTGSHVLSIGAQIDGTVLVVRAGFGHKRHIQQAARLLASGSTRLVGCILNRRTYPVPRQIYKFL